MSYIPESPYDRTTITSSGYLRTVEPFEQFSLKNRYDTADSLWIVTEDINGQVTHLLDSSAAELRISNGATDVISRQIFQSFNYLAGNTHRVATAFKANLQDGAEARLGVFDDENGFFFLLAQSSGVSQIAVVRRSKASGTVEEEIVTQEDWNIDKFDGTGESRTSLDLSKIQMVVINYTWYGGGSCAMGFEINRRIYYCHVFSAGNRLDQPIVGIPDLPYRNSIRNRLATAGDSSLTTYGLFLGIDGIGGERKGFNRGIAVPNINVTRNNTYIVLTIRPQLIFKGQQNRIHCRIEDFHIWGTAEGTYQIVYNAVFTEGTWQDVATGFSCVEYARNNTNYLGGLVLYTGGFEPFRGGNIKDTLGNKDPLVCNSDGLSTNSLSLVFTARSNGNVGAAFNWAELY